MKVTHLDLRSGGRFHYAMTPPGASLPMWGLFQYDEVIPAERLVWRSGFSDEKGGLTRNPWNPVWPLEVRNVLTLEAQGARTVLTLRGSPWNSTPEEENAFAENKKNVSQGFAGTFAQLEAHLADELTADRSLVYRRTFDAPQAVVWKAWTEPSKIAAWWGPSGFGNTIQTMDVKVGGRWLFTMHGPDGVDYPNQVVYRVVEEPSKLVYDHGTEGHPDHFQVTATFAENGTKTDLVYKMVFSTAEAKNNVVEKYGASEGLKQNMDRFAHWLTNTGLVLTRVFEAPRALIWKAFTDPAQLMKWWGPEHFTCPGATVELKVGGKYLLGMRGPDGEFWGTGVYREVILNQKLTYTDNFSDAQGNVVHASSLGLPGDWPEERLVTVTFAELGKHKTLLTVHQHHLPDEWNEMTTAGWSTSFDKLSRILK